MQKIFIITWILWVSLSEQVKVWRKEKHDQDWESEVVLHHQTAGPMTRISRIMVPVIFCAHLSSTWTVRVDHGFPELPVSPPLTEPTKSCAGTSRFIRKINTKWKSFKLGKFEISGQINTWEITCDFQRTLGLNTPGASAFINADVCIATQGCITDAGFDQRSILASAFTNATPCVTMQTSALVKATRPV